MNGFPLLSQLTTISDHRYRVALSNLSMRETFVKVNHSTAANYPPTSWGSSCELVINTLLLLGALVITCISKNQYFILILLGIRDHIENKYMENKSRMAI